MRSTRAIAPTAYLPAGAIAMATLAVAGALVATWARAGGSGDRLSAVALAATIALFAVTGCVLALARPANRIGWFLLAAACVWGVGEGLFDTGVRGIITLPGSVAGVDAYVVAGASLRAAGWLGVAIAVPLVFPDGRLPGPRWRWLGATAFAALTATFVGTGLDTHVENFQLGAAGWHNPISLPAPVSGFGDLLSSISLPLMAATVVGGVAAMISRWRRGDARIRRQLLTLATAAALPIVVIPTAFGAGWPPWIFAIAVLPLPIAVATAILSGGVFDMATVANRSLVAGTLSVAIIGIYALVIAGTGALLGTTDARWLPWLGAAVIAVSFAPLRTALQNAADRITYGRWRQPYAVLAGLSPRIEAASDTSGVLGDVVAELNAALGLTGVALQDISGQTIAGTPGPTSTRVTLTAYGRPAGALLYTEPVTPLRPSDRRLLDDLAAQLAVLMHARALTEDLRRARERLVLSREEERRRLRRDLHDGLGPALAGLMLKVDNARALMSTDPVTAERDLLLLRDDVQGTVGDVRRLVEGLRPPAIDELGLGPAIAEAVGRLAGRVGPAMEVTVIEPLPVVPAAVEVAIYRIVCEAVTNAVRHADADACVVTVECRDGSLVAQVADDGHGFADGPSSGHGLTSMRERAEELGGDLQIHSGAAGTVVAASLPAQLIAVQGVGA